MGHEQAFLDDIREHPEDDVPRLIFADWIEEHVASDRAEFIRVQCELARLDEDDVARRRQLTRREQELWRNHGKAWSKPLRAYSKKFEFSRGFADRMTMPCRTFLDHADAVFALAPAYHAKLREGRNLTPELAKCNSLLKLRSLSLNYVKMGVERAKVLAKSPNLKNLAELDLANNGLSVSGTEAVANAKGLASLKRLSLQSNGLGTGGVNVLAGSPLLGRLEYLHLGGNEIRAAAMAALASAPGFASLRELDLDGNWSLGDEGVEAIAASPHAARIEWLCLNGLFRPGALPQPFGLGTRGVTALANSTALTGLKHLHLGGCKLLDNAAFEALASGKGLPALTTLDLSHNRINLSVHRWADAYVDRDGFRSLMDSPFMERLRVLHLDRTTLLGSGARILSRSRHLTNLKRLSLSHTDVVMSTFTEAPELPALRHLDLSSNHINDRNVEDLAASPLLVQLLTLDLSRNKIGSRGAKALAASPHLRDIQELKLEGNRFTSNSKALLRKAFGDRVDLEYNNEAET